MFSHCGMYFKGAVFSWGLKLDGGDLDFFSVLNYNCGCYKENKIQIIQAEVKEYLFEE